MTTSCCDCCNETLDWKDGYLLSTTTVVLSVPFWEGQFKSAKSLVAALKFDERQRTSLFTNMLHRSAQSATPWLVCGGCVPMFATDYKQARSYALRRLDPPDTGAVDSDECAQTAAIAWELVFGRWPASVQQPKPSDSCDFCGRTVYQGEYCCTVARATRLTALGREFAPLRPPRPDKDGWLSCVGCVARFAAKQTIAECGW